MKHEVKDDPVAELMRLVDEYAKWCSREGPARRDAVLACARGLVAAHEPLTWPPILDPEKLTLDPAVETVGAEDGSGWLRVHARADGTVVQEHIPAATVMAEQLTRPPILDEADPVKVALSEALRDKADAEMLALAEKRMPIIEQPCFGNGDISLQSVAGGAHPTGLYGTVWLRIGGQVVEYVRKSSSPAVVGGEAKP